jgi:hypothetical protein
MFDKFISSYSLCLFIKPLGGCVVSTVRFECLCGNSGFHQDKSNKTRCRQISFPGGNLFRLRNGHDQASAGNCIHEESIRGKFAVEQAF